MGTNNMHFASGLPVGKAAFEAGLHGFSGGFMNAIEGGGFESGFASGVVSSIVASGVQKWGDINFASKAQKLDGIGKYLRQDVLQAIQVASGGLSGGISSTIAGGNFWAGVKQGVITSGLNHVAHSIYKLHQNNQLRKQVKKIFSNPDHVAGPIAGMIEILLDEVPIIRREYSKVFGKWNYTFSGKTSYENGMVVLAHTSSFDSGATSLTTFHNGALQSIYQLAVTVHHELIHAIHYVSKIMYKWEGEFRETIGELYASAVSEYYAYTESYKVTGDLGYYNQAENYRIEMEAYHKIYK